MQGPLIIQKDNVDQVPPQPIEMPPWYQAPDPVRRTDWRLALVLCSFLFAGLVLLSMIGWQILFADVLYPTPQQQFVRMLAAVMAVIASLALTLWLFGRALKPWLIRQPGGVIMTIPQVATLDTQAALTTALMIQHAYASRQLPNVTAMTLTNPALPKPLESAAIAALPADSETINAIPASEWLAWLNKQPHILLAAETGGGKSTTAKAILAPRIAAGEQVFCIDPHSSAWFGLPSVGGGENWSEVQRAMHCVLEEYRTRLTERERYVRETGQELPKEHFQRLNVLFDEMNIARKYTDAAKRGETSVWQLFTQVLGSGARKVHISIIGMGQSANVGDLGLSGAMRENFCRIALDSAAARKLIQSEESNPKRRELLYAALTNREFPAVCEWRGQMFLLDRTGLDRVQEPPNTRGALWLGWDYNAAPPAPAPSVLDLLKRARAKGWTRDQARAALARKGLSFDNALWTQAGD